MFYTKIDTLLDAQIFFAALELDIYTKLEGGKTVEELAANLQCSAEVLACFLSILTGKELLHQENGVFYPQQEVWQFLSKKSPEYIGEVLLFRRKLSSLPDIKTVFYTAQKRNTEAMTQEGIFDFAEMARVTSTEICLFRKQTLLSSIAAVFDRTPKKVLDLGGGVGAMLEIIAEYYPDASCILFEQPAVAKGAYEYIKNLPSKQRITIIEGNFIKDDIGNQYDLIIASGIFAFVGGQLENFIHKIVLALQNKGFLFVYDVSYTEKKHQLLFEQRWLLANIRAGSSFKTHAAIDSILQKTGFILVQKTSDDLYPLYIYQKT